MSEVIPRNSFVTNELNIFTFEYVWTIKNFGFYREKLASSTFSSGLSDINDKWCLYLYPKVMVDNQEYVSIQLKLLACSEEITEIITQYKISILKSLNKEANIKCSEGPQIFSESNTVVQLKRFIKREDLFDQTWESNYIKNDTLTILCEIKILLDKNSAKNNSPLNNLKNDQQLINSLGELLTSGDSSDVIFQVKSKSFQAIKGIMAARSPVFKGMFKHENMKENDNNEVVIDDIEPDVFEELMNFIYTNKTLRLTKMAQSLLAAAEKYQLDDLKRMCEKELIKHITDKDAAHLLVFADTYNALDLKKECLDFIRNRLKIVVSTKGFQELKESHGPVFIAVLEALASKK